MKAEILHDGIGYERMSSPHFCIMPEATLEITSPHLCIMASEALALYREPLVNIRTTGDAFHLTVEMPGVSSEGVELSLTGRLLEIEGRCRAAEGPGELTYRETASKLFYKWLELPEECAEDGIQTTFADGILEVLLPKKTARKTVRHKVD